MSSSYSKIFAIATYAYPGQRWEISARDGGWDIETVGPLTSWVADGAPALTILAALDEAAGVTRDDAARELVLDEMVA